MRRTLLLSFAGLAAMVALAAPAQAQVITQDSVTGQGVADPTAYTFFDIAATSGPLGENTTGQVALALFNGEINVAGPVTCLAVAGQRAVIGFRDDRPMDAGQVIVEVEDLGGPGSGLDTINSSGGTGRDPSDCSPLTGGLFARVNSGDIVVHDAQPFPTAKDQCKNGGWRNYGTAFTNQGQCIAFVQTTPKP